MAKKTKVSQSDISKVMAALGARGGAARAAKMSTAQRSEMGRAMVRKRWAAAKHKKTGNL